MSDKACVVGTEFALPEESPIELDTTISYTFEIDLICKTALIDSSVRAKNGVITANRVCVGTADEDVSCVIKVVKKTCHSNDAHFKDVEGEKLTIDTVDTTTFYSGVLIKEVNPIVVKCVVEESTESDECGVILRTANCDTFDGSDCLHRDSVHITVCPICSSVGIDIFTKETEISPHG